MNAKDFIMAVPPRITASEKRMLLQSYVVAEYFLAVPVEERLEYLLKTARSRQFDKGYKVNLGELRAKVKQMTPVEQHETVLALSNAYQKAIKSIGKWKLPQRRARRKRL